MPIVASVTMMVMTTISSMIVNPRAEPPLLPVAVFGAVKCGSLELRVDVEDILPAPSRGVRIVLVRPLSPFGRVRHRIDRYAAQEFKLTPRRIVLDRDAIDEDLQIRRVSFTANLDLERRDLLRISGVLV